MPPVAADDGGELGVSDLGEGQRGDRVAGCAGPLPLQLVAAQDPGGLGSAGKARPAATAVTFRVRRPVRPCPCSRLSQAFGTSRQGSAAAWACRPGWLRWTISR